MPTGSISLWIGFNVLVLALLALDLGVFHRHDRAMKTKEAATWTGIWIALALLFGLAIHWWMGPEAALQYFTGYLIEKSLSVDNIFVFVLIFSYFAVPNRYQYRVLFWGILGALVMRAILIVVGATLIQSFHWIIYVFGALLVYTGLKMAFHGPEAAEPHKSPLVRLFRKFIPMTEDYEGHSFFVRKDRKLYATPLFLVLLVVESSDLIFAVDSIPAIFAVTRDPFLVYTSNIFAILGLRSLYFLLAGVIDKFRYLKPALASILAFVGTKMLVSDIFPIPTFVSLGVILGVLTIAVSASLIRPVEKKRVRI